MAGALGVAAAGCPFLMALQQALLFLWRRCNLLYPSYGAATACPLWPPVIMQKGSNGVYTSQLPAGHSSKGWRPSHWSQAAEA